jgi:hypothetical protein
MVILKRKRMCFGGKLLPATTCCRFTKMTAIFLKGLERFVGDGFKTNESVIVIATASHLKGLENTLKSFDLSALRSRDQYIPLDAEETLSRFMVNGWPEDDLFESCVTRLLRRARSNGRRARAFGEMVALLWAQGHNGATVRLEYLWQELCKKENFSLLCAYPKTGFTEEASSAIQKICSAHTKMCPAAA